MFAFCTSLHNLPCPLLKNMFVQVSFVGRLYCKQVWIKCEASDNLAMRLIVPYCPLLNYTSCGTLLRTNLQPVLRKCHQGICREI